MRTVTDAWLREVSVGEALALTKDPPLLLLDEPASAMDTAAERAFIDRLKAAYAGRSIILITHRASLLELVDRVLVADGPKDKVLAPVINRTATVAKA